MAAGLSPEQRRHQLRTAMEASRQHDEETRARFMDAVLSLYVERGVIRLRPCRGRRGTQEEHFHVYPGPTLREQAGETGEDVDDLLSVALWQLENVPYPQ